MDSPDSCELYKLLSLRSITFLADSYSLLVGLSSPVRFKDLSLKSVQLTFSEYSHKFSPSIELEGSEFGSSFLIHLGPS